MAYAYSGMPRVPNFKVHKLLGKGSYGRVYKVERDSDGQLYALKETDMGTMTQVERMDAVNEVRLMVSINHPNVIRYNEAFLTGNKLNVVMEYAPFGDLRYYIAKGAKLNMPFPEEAIWRIFLQMCKGLAALHSNCIVHRDIKPANIFLCQNDLLKIGDLGIAKALTHINFARTQIGTPCYMAPEVWSGRPYAYTSDLWSLGAVLYEMMTFKTPMEGRNMQELKLRILGGRYSPVSGGRYSTELVNFCYALLSTDPKKRPSPTTVLTSSAAAKWLKVLPAAPKTRRMSFDGGAGKPLMDTIQVPRDLKQLKQNLPPPCYDGPDDQAQAPPQTRSPPGANGSSSAPCSRPVSGGPGGPSAHRPASAPRGSQRPFSPVQHAPAPVPALPRLGAAIAQAYNPSSRPWQAPASSSSAAAQASRPPSPGHAQPLSNPARPYSGHGVGHSNILAAAGASRAASPSVGHRAAGPFPSIPHPPAAAAPSADQQRPQQYKQPQGLPDVASRSSSADNLGSDIKPVQDNRKASVSSNAPVQVNLPSLYAKPGSSASYCSDNPLSPLHQQVMNAGMQQRWSPYQQQPPQQPMPVGGSRPTRR